jgi:hypothetical protein
MSQQDMTMLLLDVLTGEDNVPVIVSDLRAQILEARQRGVPLVGLEQLDKTQLFTLLSVLRTVGLVERGPEGYTVSDSGRTRARALREEQPLPERDRLDAAAKAALARAS